MKVGVFDSGIGGAAVAQRLQDLLPEATIIMANDHEHVPYGGRPEAEIITLADDAIQPLLEQQVDAIVIACNTVTTVGIEVLRQRYPHLPFVGIEPMVKPAATMTKSDHIAVLATPSTLASHRYAELKEQWAASVKVEEPDCSTWAKLIEDGRAEEVPIEQTVEQLIDQGVDVIVFACTHYHWLKDRAVQTAGTRASILEPTDAIHQRIIDLLGKHI